jgi:tripartite-type tricarboxylate transporter receptor subunit TctC
LSAAPVLLSWTPLSAQTAFPNRPIEVVISFPPGGPTDTAPRILIEYLRPLLKGASLVPLNKAGAGGGIAAEYVNRSTPDGHTILATSNPALSVKSAIEKNLSYKIEDFAAIGMYATDFGILAAQRDLGIKTIDELIARAKQSPEGLNYASAGMGTVTHISTELFKTLAGINILHVPHRGSGPAAQAILGGHVKLLSSAYSAAAPLIESGHIVPLITTAPKRLAELPDVPTVAERGMPEVELNIWMGLFVPTETPRTIVTTLTDALAEAAKDPAFNALLTRARLTPRYGDPAATIALLQKERTVVSQLAQKTKLGE